MANKFISNLVGGSQNIKEARAKIIAEDAEAAQAELLRKLNQEARDLERKKIALSDLYPDSELSLLVAKSDFNANKWVDSLQDIGVQLLNKQVEIKVAQATYDAWFKEEVSDETISK